MLIFHRKNKGQVFPLMVTITVILIIAALITANLGKVSMDRLYCMNGADAGAVAGASDYTMGYNRATKPDMAMVIVYVAIQTFLAIPMWVSCIGARGSFAAVAKTFNDILYNIVKPYIVEYSKSAPRDAYYYAFINSGIDDRTKEDGTDRPGSGVAWSTWINQKSAFGVWLNNISKNENWANAPSYTYHWRDGSGKSVTVYVSTSGIEQLRHQTMPLIGVYLTGFPLVPVIPWWHGNIKAWIKDPSTSRQASVRVERVRANREVSVGFWTALHPATRASATAQGCLGGALGFIPHINGYDFALTSAN